MPSKWRGEALAVDKPVNYRSATHLPPRSICEGRRYFRQLARTWHCKQPPIYYGFTTPKLLASRCTVYQVRYEIYRLTVKIVHHSQQLVKDKSHREVDRVAISPAAACRKKKARKQREHHNKREPECINANSTPSDSLLRRRSSWWLGPRLIFSREFEEAWKRSIESQFPLLYCTGGINLLEHPARLQL